jgi:predicted NBD/HSP70 family sugar kinase
VNRRYPAGPQSLLRSINGRAVLEAVSLLGPATTADVAVYTGLSRPTTAAAVADLLDRGVIEEAGPVLGRKGPAASLYRVNAGCAWALGVDVGHRRIRAALCDLSGEIRGRAEQAVRPGSGRDALVAQVAATCAAAAERAGVDLASVTRIAAGVPAVVGADGRTLSYADGLPESGLGLGYALADALPAPLVLENDVNLAALAESIRGLGAQVRDFVLISLGVGLGLGMFVDGRLRRGATGAAGEAGYLPSNRVAAADPGRQGPDLLRRHLGTRHITAEARRLGLPGDGSPQSVFALARSGDPGAELIVQDTARSIAYVISCVVPLVDPGLVVLGGAIGSNGDLLLDAVQRSLADYSPFRPPIAVSQLGSDAVLFGATASAAQSAREAVFSAATDAPPPDPLTAAAGADSAALRRIRARIAATGSPDQA